MNDHDRKSTKVIVVGGGGTIGSSTALHLLRSGYEPSNITVLDVYPIPSPQSAGHDRNKIMNVQLRNPPDLSLSMEALDMWRNDDLFKPFFHNVGVVRCSSSTDGVAKLRAMRKARIAAHSDLERQTTWLDSEEDIVARLPTFSQDQVKGWQGLLCSEGGWLAAAKAIDAIGRFLKSEGVQFAFGRAGTFARPLLTESGMTCVGFETTDGTTYYADKVVFAAGAWSPTLVDLEGQCVSKAWVLAHLQLTPAEVSEYKDCPVVYDGDFGFFFEPDEDGIIKICDEFSGFTRFQMHQPFGSAEPISISAPRSHAQHPSDTYPDASEVTIRKALGRFLPAFRERQLVYKAMCWCTDTADANLLICEHPRWKNFILATGDSGHSFKFLPNIGKYLVHVVEGTLAPELAHEWRWRPGEGDAVRSTRAAAARDLADLEGWRQER